MSGDGIGRLTQMLELNEFKLNSLLEITKGINNNLSIPNILKIYEYILREQLGISKLLLYAYDQKNWKCILHFGAKGLNKKIKVAEELIHIKDITVIESSSIDTLNSFDIKSGIDLLSNKAVSYKHLRAHETIRNLLCRLIL